MFDISLLYELKEGNRDAFNSMFRYYYPRMMAYVTALVEEEVAEDIVQDVFLYVWENHAKLYVGNGFHSYLFQAAYTRCLDYFKKKTSIEKYQSSVYDAYIEEYDNLQKTDDSIIDELSTKEFYKRLYELLEQMPMQRREVFVLTYIKGMKAKEISELANIPQRTVESHIYLALKFLKGNMSKKDFYLLCVLILAEKASVGGT